MDKFITDWVATNCDAADCANLGFAQAFLQFNVYTKICPRFDTTLALTFFLLGLYRVDLRPDYQLDLPSLRN